LPQPSVPEQDGQASTAGTNRLGPYIPGRTGSPRLHGVLAVLDCTVEYRLPGGDHEIVIGRVREAEISGNGSPVLFWQGRYASLG